MMEEKTRLIDAVKFWDNLNDEFEMGVTDAIEAVNNALDNTPVVDVEPVRHGCWIDDSGEGDAAVCSCCGECYDTTEAEYDWRKAFDLFRQFYHYCPNCGAKMDEEETNG